MFWGLTPSLDILDVLEEVGELPEEINVLLVGCADARHILKTLARKYRHKDVKINFYVMEACMETLAKQLILLVIALQPPESLGLVQKTRFFMELYGNSILRPAVAKYLHGMAKQLIKMITDPDYMKAILPLIDLDIKYRERDYLENVLKFWCGSDEFNISQYWDNRLRKSLGVRYDTRSGAFDWDLHMRYHVIGGSQVCNQEYQHFRQSGVAFGWLESEVSKPNRSMVCGLIPNGESYAHYGYMGDMITGPYVAYGLDCEDEKFMKSQNGKKVHRATDVTERNLLQIFHEIEHQCEYTHTQINDLPLGTIVSQLALVKVVDVGAGGENSALKPIHFLETKNITITFLSLHLLAQMAHKKKYHDFFNVIYFNSVYLKHFQADLINLISLNNGLLLIENEIFVLSNRDKQLEEYDKNIKEKVIGVNCEHLKFNALKDKYAKFVFKK